MLDELIQRRLEARAKLYRRAFLTVAAFALACACALWIPVGLPPGMLWLGAALLLSVAAVAGPMGRVGLLGVSCSAAGALLSVTALEVSITGAGKIAALTWFAASLLISVRKPHIDVSRHAASAFTFRSRFGFVLILALLMPLGWTFIFAYGPTFVSDSVGEGAAFVGSLVGCALVIQTVVAASRFGLRSARPTVVAAVGASSAGLLYDISRWIRGDVGPTLAEESS